MTKSNEVLIFDTTLRDGEQSPGATMTHDEKLEIAGLLDDMGVDIIEAGFPDRLGRRFQRGVRDCASWPKSATICGLARANYKDIDRCWEAVKHAKATAHSHLHRHLAAAPRHPEPEHG